MKTAMQELIEKFTEVLPLDYDVQLMILRGKVEELLTKEREQLEHAFENGFSKGGFITFEQYKKETFNL